MITKLFTRIASGQPVLVVTAWLKDEHGIAKTYSAVADIVRRPVYWSRRWKVDSADGTVAVHKTQAIVSHDLWLTPNESRDASRRPTRSRGCRRAPIGRAAK